MVEDERLQSLNDKPANADGAYVLYWMQASMRTRYNHALAEAVARAEKLEKPVVVGFGVMDDYPEANARHYAFMLQGLADVAANLKDKGIRFVLRHGHPADVALELAKDACLVICDRGYTAHQKAWRDTVGEKAGVQAIQVESDIVVPVETASDKLESAARTIRRKINDRRDDFIQEMRIPSPSKSSLTLGGLDGLDASDWEGVLDKLKLDRAVKPVIDFTGGEEAGQRLLNTFIDDNLEDYADRRSVPHDGAASRLSPYLHFGNLSPVEIALKCKDAIAPQSEGLKSFLEEMIVRRELSINFVNYCPDYDKYSGAVPDWAQTTLKAHRPDDRPHIYTREEMEAADTHDDIWNAAMTEMVERGYLNNHVRMYWVKRIMDWTNTPEYAHETALYLNNKYFLDGRDPNSFSNIAWAFGRHDRPFQERAVIGKVRPFTDAALKRRFDVKAYVTRVRDGDLFS